MKQVYTALFLSIVFTSCVTRISYLGSSSTPTQNVDVYVDASAIKRPYTIVGKAFPEYAGYSQWLNKTDKLQEKVVEVARKKGADAVLFQDYYVQHGGTNIYSVTRTDTLNKAVVTTTSGSVAPIAGVTREILFLKYN
ncbi:MAG TPA: hypothetical protein VGB71_18260 [Flavisolibacter sp.]|jgi:hypothetical protein